MHQLFSGDWLLVLKGLVDTRQYFKNMFAKLNIDLPVDTFIEYWLSHDSNINTEIISVLESIRGPNLYIGTNQDRSRTTFLQATFEPYFDKIFSSYQMGALKPEPEFFGYIESNLNMQPADIAFIDDAKSHIEAAAQRGWTCHHYQNIDKLKNFLKEL